jgi:hypothetical protein
MVRGYSVVRDKNSSDPLSSSMSRPFIYAYINMNLYSSPDIIRMIKSRRMRWAGMYHEWGRRGMHIGYLWESQKEGDH